MIHPHTELRFISPDVGYGVFATRFIPKGTVLWTLCRLDRVFTPADISILPENYLEILARYSYVNSAGNVVLCWDFGRYLNHSCNANMLPLNHEVEIAIRDIQAGEEITCEYGTCNIGNELNCQCGSSECRSVIRGEDVLTYSSVWRERVRAAMAHFHEIEQPLLPFIREQEQFLKQVTGVEDIPDQAEFYYSVKIAAPGNYQQGPWRLPAITNHSKTGT